MDRVHGFGSWVHGIVDHSRSLILWSAAQILLKWKGFSNLILALHLWADSSHQTQPTGRCIGPAWRRHRALTELHSQALGGTATWGFRGKMTRGSTGSLSGTKRGWERLQGGSRRWLPSSNHRRRWAAALALFWLQEAAQCLPHGLLLLLPATDWLERRRGSSARRWLGFDSCGSKVGFLYWIVDGKDPNIFLVWVKLYLTMFRKKSKRG
jgi:hypothetical protein